MKKLALLLTLSLACLAWFANDDGSASEMAAAARVFLVSLSPELQERATFAFQDEERFNWHFIPRERKGLPFRDMAAGQRKLAQGFLASGLSPQGYIKANQVMYLDQILHVMENNAPRRDPDGYFFSIFGEPSATRAWGWRVEGHHLSLNYTVNDGKISALPMFYGANPGEVRQGPHQGLRVMQAEEDLGRQLVATFQGSLTERVIIDVQAPRDIVSGTSRQAEIGDPVGVSLAQMDRSQKEILSALIDVYVGRLQPELAEAELARIRQAGLEKIHFAWAGGTGRGEPHYYRIQGPTFLIEYDNTQNNANHIHTVWRDLENDFGKDLLGEHYTTSAHHSHPRSHD
ncbi:MAG: DUF3500 domain-containing protein [Acidobacteriota bacterium]